VPGAGRPRHVVRAGVERRHSVLLRRGVRSCELLIRLCQRRISRGSVAGGPCGLCRAVLPRGLVELGQHDLELVSIVIRLGLVVTSLLDE
jgi:hypothetical protein